MLLIGWDLAAAKEAFQVTTPISSQLDQGGEGMKACSPVPEFPEVQDIVRNFFIFRPTPEKSIPQVETFSQAADFS